MEITISNDCMSHKDIDGDNENDLELNESVIDGDPEILADKEQSAEEMVYG